MASQGYHRKFTTTLSADVAGYYSRLLQHDEAAALKTVSGPNGPKSEIQIRV